jgi:limonene-1,2-epoxide hydrolase
MVETAEPLKTRDVVVACIKTFLGRVRRFEVRETLAKGPMVVNERVDHFTSGELRSRYGGGVFFLKGGKIVDWYDYTIAMERA